jgi:hypothetical protein
LTLFTPPWRCDKNNSPDPVVAGAKLWLRDEHPLLDPDVRAKVMGRPEAAWLARPVIVEWKLFARQTTVECARPIVVYEISDRLLPLVHNAEVRPYRRRVAFARGRNFFTNLHPKRQAAAITMTRLYCRSCCSRSTSLGQRSAFRDSVSIKPSASIFR